MSEQPPENENANQESPEEVAPEEPTVFDKSQDAQSEVKSHTILDKDYTVDPDRGYRRQG